MVRLYVGGLAPSVSPLELRERFLKVTSSVGDVEVLKDSSGQSRGFGYVDVGDEAQSEDCIKLYNRTAWRGSRLRVEKANESYLERLQRDWAASDGESAAPVADDRLTAEGPEGQAAEAEAKPNAAESRFLRIRRQSGQKAVMVSTRPLIVRDASDVGSRRRKTRVRSVKTTAFEDGGVREKTLEDIWSASVPTLEEQLTRATQSDTDHASVADDEEEERSMSEQEALSFLWDEEDGRKEHGRTAGQSDNEHDVEEAQDHGEASTSVSEQGGEENQLEDFEPKGVSDDEIARYNDILSGLLALSKGGRPSAGRSANDGAPRQQPKVASVAMLRYDPGRADATTLELRPEEAVIARDSGEHTQAGEQVAPKAAVLEAAAPDAKASPAGDGVGRVDADVQALTSIYRTFRPSEGEDVRLPGAEGGVGFTFGFSLGQEQEEAQTTRTAAITAMESAPENGSVATTSEAQAAVDAAVAVGNGRPWWPDLEEIRQSAKLFVQMRVRQNQDVELMKKERQSLASDFKRKRRAAVNFARKRGRVQEA